MTAQRQKVIDLLAAGRVANLPSVVSNVTLGLLMGLVISGSEVPWSGYFLVLAIGAFLYLGGCFLNDWKDVAWDAEHKPERAVPSGRIDRKSLGLLGWGFLAVGALLAVFAPLGVMLSVVFIVAVILIYTWLHKLTAWAVIPMGMARGGLYLLGFAAVASFQSEGAVTMLGPRFAAIVCYIAGLSIWARSEAKEDGNLAVKYCGTAFVFFAVVLQLSLLPGDLSFHFVLGCLLWGILSDAARNFSDSVGKGVSALLSIIPLLDLIVIFSLGVNFSLELLPWVMVSMVAFFTAILLQRYAPAT